VDVRSKRLEARLLWRWIRDRNGGDAAPTTSCRCQFSSAGLDHDVKAKVTPRIIRECRARQWTVEAERTAGNHAVVEPKARIPVARLESGQAPSHWRGQSRLLINPGWRRGRGQGKRLVERRSYEDVDGFLRRLSIFVEWPLPSFSTSTRGGRNGGLFVVERCFPFADSSSSERT